MGYRSPGKKAPAKQRAAGHSSRADDCSVSPSLREAQNGQLTTPDQAQANVDAAGAVLEFYAHLFNRVVNVNELRSLLDSSALRHVPFSIAERVKAMNALMEEAKIRMEHASVKQTQLVYLQRTAMAGNSFTESNSELRVTDENQLKQLLLTRNLSYGPTRLASFLANANEQLRKHVSTHITAAVKVKHLSDVDNGFSRLMYSPLTEVFFVTYPTQSAGEQTVLFKIVSGTLKISAGLQFSYGDPPHDSILLFDQSPDDAVNVVMGLRVRSLVAKAKTTTTTTTTTSPKTPKTTARTASATRRHSSGRNRTGRTTP